MEKLISEMKIFSGLKSSEKKEFNGSKEYLISKINSQEGTLYQFGKLEGLQTTIIIQED